MSTPTVYELYAIKYGEHHRPARQNFAFQDIHDGPMPLDFFIWVAASPEKTYVIDIGFDQATGERRDRQILRHPSEALALLGIDAAKVEDVIVTHLHFDHAGSQGAFAKARFHLQDREMSYATGRYMCHDRIRLPFDVENVTDMVRHVYDGRVAFHDGDDQLDSGLSLHLVGGHSHGLQIVRVHTRRGRVVVASDAAHLYAHMETGNPFPIVFNVGDMLEGHRRCHQLADSPDHVVPGHDPLVMARYPAVSKELEGIAVRLDVPPVREGG
ncbi:MAG: N-acyl homoserine lactonase family protein [Alphaproteobacteria bacterium]|nr:N-acyl homoserine lactonase family protein [Alphaproteobacteria bacterium]